MRSDVTMLQCCKNCKNLMVDLDPTTLYRCGVSYFNKSPKNRKAKRLDTYPETNAKDWCEDYKAPDYITIFKNNNEMS